MNVESSNLDHTKVKAPPLMDKFSLRKPAVIESVNDQLKNICQIEHIRHRSIWNFMANMLAALCAHALQPKKTIYKITYATINYRKLISLSKTHVKLINQEYL